MGFFYSVVSLHPMPTKNTQPLIIFVLFAIAVLYSAASIFLGMHEKVGSEQTSYLWAFIFSILVAMWANTDAKEKNLYKPFEYSYFVFLAWPLAMPYHLIKTRGIEGLLIFLGLVLLFVSPFVSWLVSWTYLAPAS